MGMCVSILGVLTPATGLLRRAGGCAYTQALNLWSLLSFLPLKDCLRVHPPENLAKLERFLHDGPHARTPPEVFGEFAEVSSAAALPAAQGQAAERW